MISQRAPDNDKVLTRLAAARRMAGGLQPYSPAWDAAMAWVDDLEVEAGYKWTTGGTAEPEHPRFGAVRLETATG